MQSPPFSLHWFSRRSRLVTEEMGGNASAPRVYEGTLQPPAGLRNLGNTCYMNSALQCLFQTHGFNQLLNTSHTSNLTQSYFQLLARQQSLRQLYRVKKEMKKQGKQFAGFKQMDAEEFLLYFFERLITTNSLSRKDLEGLFEVRTTHVYFCTDCKSEAKSESESCFLSLPLTPANVTIKILPGAPGNTEITVTGTELMTSVGIELEVKKTLGKEKVWLLLQSRTEVLRAVSGCENLKQMDLNSKSLCFYEVEDNECLAEIKVYRKGFNRQFVLYRVKKLNKAFNPTEIRERFASELREELGVPVLAMTTEHAAAPCLPWKTPAVPVEQGDYTTVLQSKRPVLRLMALINGNVSPVPFPHSKVLRSAEVLDIEALLKHFAAEEPIPDKYNCEVCQADTQHSKVSHITKLSKYLIVTLQRYNSVDGSKDNRMVTFPLNLTVGQTHFQVYGVVQHIGDSFSSGHYKSVVRFGSDWFLCNDAIVTPIQPHLLPSLAHENAYLLFFEAQ